MVPFSLKSAPPWFLIPSPEIKGYENKKLLAVKDWTKTLEEEEGRHYIHADKVSKATAT